jgi:DNA repair protein RecO (recombination protein O)
VVISLILKKEERGEADELVLFLARDLGWLRGVAKNSRKSRVRFGGHLEPLSLADLVLRPRRKDDLVWISESQVVDGFLGMRTDVVKVSHAAYFLELASIFQGEEHPDPGLFDFLLRLLERLDRSPFNPLGSLLDEIRLLGLLGFTPGFELCPACGKAVEPGEEGLFSLSLGGACHAGCLPRGEPRLTLSPDTLAVVRRGLDLDEEPASRLRLGAKGLQELRALLSSFVRYLRGYTINSLLFIEKTGLWRDRVSAGRER